jgi:hypothetical protein
MTILPIGRTAGVLDVSGHYRTTHINHNLGHRNNARLHRPSK